MLNEDSLTDGAKHSLLHGDIDLMNEHGCSDTAMSIIACEHAARTETLLKAVQCPSLGRNLLLSVAQALLNAAKEIDFASIQEPELIHVG